MTPNCRRRREGCRSRNAGGSCWPKREHTFLSAVHMPQEQSAVFLSTKMPELKGQLCQHVCVADQALPVPFWLSVSSQLANAALNTYVTAPQAGDCTGTRRTAHRTVTFSCAGGSRTGTVILCIRQAAAPWCRKAAQNTGRLCTLCYASTCHTQMMDAAAVALYLKRG